eukprot:gene5502-biopygen3567
MRRERGRAIRMYSDACTQRRVDCQHRGVGCQHRGVGCQHRGMGCQHRGMGCQIAAFGSSGGTPAPRLTLRPQRGLSGPEMSGIRGPDVR